MNRTTLARTLVFFAAASLLAACGGGKQPAANEITVLLEAGYAGQWPAGLDPATNTTARANLSMMNAIFGGLFQLSANDAGKTEVVGVLAQSYEIVDEGRTLVLHLREGVQFSDGTPFDAEAVRRNIERNLKSPCTCTPRDWPWAAEHGVTAPDAKTVQLHFSRPFGAAINALPVSNINWIASLTALEAMGPDQFRIMPVGAGPFRIVSNQLSTRLVLERNPRYWEHGRPKLDRLVFQPIGNEQSGIQALLAGDAQVYESMTSPAAIQVAQKAEKLRVTMQPATSPYVIQLNTTRAPFDERRAREAIYYATNVDAIRKGLFNDWYAASQSFTGPGGLFHDEHVPGYRTYDVDAARTLVHEAGGLRVKLATLRTPAAEQIAIALQTQWHEAGIDVSLELLELPAVIRTFQSGQWDAMLQTVGSYDPEAGSGVGLRFSSHGAYSGVRDAELDRILSDAAAALDHTQRRELYRAAAQRISDNAYAPFLLAFAPAQITALGVQGPGLTTRIPPILVNTGVLWHAVTIE